MRSPKSAHILIISKLLFPNIIPNKNLIAPLQWGIHKISVCFVRHKKICLLVALPQWRDYSRQFQSTTQRKVCSIQLRLRIVGIDKLEQKPGLIPPAPKISILPTSQISKRVPNILNTNMRNSWTTPSMTEFSKLSDQNSNLQLLPAKTSLTSNYKISFIKIRLL